MFKSAQPIREPRVHSPSLPGSGVPSSVAAGALAVALLASAASLRGQALPPTAPTIPLALGTSPPTEGQAKTYPPIQSLPSAQEAQDAHVTYAAGRLQVAAANSSINQILREIGRVTGMKITGSVPEERVFGSYGPADPSSVLYSLLDGTGSNMLLRVNSARIPEELVLTPRQEGVTPPNPNASSNAGREDDLPPERRLGLRPQPAESIPALSPGFTQTPGSAPNSAPATAQPAQGFQGPQGPQVPAANTTTQQSPNGVKTPQEIYDQLMKMQQQQKPPL